MRLIRRDNGDTVIEVLFAITVFAMVAVGSLTIMNQGTAAAQRALEINLVRQQIDAQAEAIRYIHQAYVTTFQREGTPAGTAAEWGKMTVDRGATVASLFGETAGDTCPDSVPGESPFVLNARTATVASAVPQMSAPAGGSLPPFAQVIYNSDSSINQAYGIWVEAVPSPSGASDGPGFVDFHIRACWESPGSSAPMTLGTIVRLYEPR